MRQQQLKHTVLQSEIIQLLPSQPMYLELGLTAVILNFPSTPLYAEE